MRRCWLGSALTALVALLPALNAYRTDVAANLNRLSRNRHHWTVLMINAPPSVEHLVKELFLNGR